jgi:hypothetical protein
MPDNSIAPIGRSNRLVLGALAVFGLAWWFLPVPSSNTQTPTTTTKPDALPKPLQAEAMPQIDIANPSTLPSPPVSNNSVPRRLGPSKGSLMANPKPRDLLPNFVALSKLDSLDRHMTAQTVEEAEWMDLQEFPSIEEVNSINAESLEKYHHRPNVNLRALAVQAAIWKRQGNPAWKGAAEVAAGLGSIFANRLLIDNLMSEKFSLNRDKLLIHRVQLGKLLGDSYFQTDIAADGALRWPTHKIMSNFEITLNEFQIYIPYYRSRRGLPPLQIVRIPGQGRLSVETLTPTREVQ